MYKLDVLVIEDFQILKKQTKFFYDLRNKLSLSDWVRDKKFKLTENSFATTNGVRITEKNKKYKVPKHFLGYFHDHSNNVQNNTSGVGIYTSMFSDSHGCFVDETNFHKIIVAYTARTLIKPNWINEKDEYLEPKQENSDYQQFANDSIVLTLFNNTSYQSSLRQITYKDKLWDIKNEFFWMSKEEMLNLANENSYSDLYNDARTDSERHVYKLLFGEERIYDKLSPDAKLVLDKATELVRKSMSMREVFANDENHLKSWDAGYAQLKILWKQYYAEDFKEFRELYKNLEDRMRPLVYELGFLMK